jgi:hypothetical protein
MDAETPKPKPARKIPDEFEILTLKLTQKLKKVEKDLAAFLLVGSVAQKNYVKNVSDCDFYLVIKKNRDKQTEILQNIGAIKNEFEADPQYSSILDLMVFFEEDLTDDNIKASNIINWVHIWTGQQGELKLGKANPFSNIKVTPKMFKLGTIHMCFDNILLIRDGILNAPPGNEEELVFYASEAAVGCAQAYLLFIGEKNFNRYTIPEIFAEKVKLNVDAKVIMEARDYRLSGKIDNAAEFIERCYDFSWKIYETMLKEY